MEVERSLFIKVGITNLRGGKQGIQSLDVPVALEILGSIRDNASGDGAFAYGQDSGKRGG